MTEAHTREACLGIKRENICSSGEPVSPSMNCTVACSPLQVPKRQILAMHHASFCSPKKNFNLSPTYFVFVRILVGAFLCYTCNYVSISFART